MGNKNLLLKEVRVSKEVGDKHQNFFISFISHFFTNNGQGSPENSLKSKSFIIQGG